MLDVLLNHLCGDIAGTADEVPTREEMLSPVSFLKFREFHLEFPRRLALDVLHERGDGGGWVNGDEEMDMIGSHGTTQYFNPFFVADATYQYFRSLTDVTFQYLVPILRYPTHVDSDGEYRM